MAKNKPVTATEERRARAIVQRAMDQQKARSRAEHMNLVNRCYRYPNRFSDGERWWTYAVVTGVDEHDRMSVLQVQRDSNGVVTISDESYYAGLLPNGGWEPISGDEFMAGCLAVGRAALMQLASATARAALGQPDSGRGDPPVRSR